MTTSALDVKLIKCEAPKEVCDQPDKRHHTKFGLEGMKLVIEAAYGNKEVTGMKALRR